MPHLCTGSVPLDAKTFDTTGKRDFITMIWLECGVLFLVACLVTVALTPFSRWIAWKLGAVDYPDARRVNTQAIPRMGGLAILGGLLAAIIVSLIGSQFFGWHDPFGKHPTLNVNYVGVGIGALFIFAVGFIDDIFDLSAKVKLLGQIIAACIVAASGLLFTSIHNPFGPGFIEFGWFAYPISVFYLVAFANIINLIDGLDGLAAGISGISALTIFIFALQTFHTGAAIISIALAGACVGFLKNNHHPANVFMGDSGALLLGFLLGIASLLAIARSALFVSLLVPILAAGVPIIDTAFAIFRRVREHRPIDSADKGHIHHRLLRAGFSQNQTVAIMWGWTAILAICGILITVTDGIPRVIITIIVIGVTVFVIRKLHLVDPVLIHHYSPRNKKESSLTSRESQHNASAPSQDSQGSQSSQDPQESQGDTSSSPRKQ